MRLAISVVLALLVSICPDAAAQKKVNFGGTNHWLYAYGTADGTNTGNSWYLPALNLRPTVAHYHLNPSLVDSQISALKSSGQNAYIVDIWNSDLGPCESSTCNDGVADGVWGEIIDNSLMEMRSQHRQNLKSIIGKALDVGFSRIYIRFNYNSHPQNWVSWDEVRYLKVWGFISDAHDAALEVVHSRNLSSKLTHPSSLLVFDLGGEFAGFTGGQRGNFMQRLWSDYVGAYGNDDTVGFSFVWAPGMFTTQVNLLQSTGTLPKQWAFDIYSNFSSTITSIYSEMGALRNQPVHILETYFNNSSVGTQIGTALASNDLLNIQLVGQWPLYSGDPGHFSQSAVNAFSTTATYSNYVGLLATRKMHFTSTNANLLSVKDINCGSTATLTCSVRIGWASAPSGKLYGVYFKHTGGGTTLVHCVNNAGQSTVPWIGQASAYVFDLYLISGTSCNNPNPNVGATKVATIEATPY